MQIVLASHNLGKIKEIKALLAGLPITLISQSELNIAEVPETGTTFVENALIKARHAAGIARLPAIADDSGLAIDALKGAPGIYSARYAGENASDQERINKVLMQLSHVPEQQRTAHYHCAIVLVRSVEDPLPIVCEGIWSGTLLHKPQGDHGFGYDPIFYVPEQGCSAAELDRDLKNQISHRGLAMNQFRTLLMAEMGLKVS